MPGLLVHESKSSELCRCTLGSGWVCPWDNNSALKGVFLMKVVSLVFHVTLFPIWHCKLNEYLVFKLSMNLMYGIMINIHVFINFLWSLVHL